MKSPNSSTHLKIKLSFANKLRARMCTNFGCCLKTSKTNRRLKTLLSKGNQRL